MTARASDESGPGGRTRTSAAALKRTLPRLHVITDDDVLSRPDWMSSAREVLDAGGEAIALHVRGPSTSGRLIYGWVRTLLDAAAAGGARIVVNDRVDVAMVLPAHGVQLPERSLPVEDARRLLPERVWIGASVHSPDAAGRGQQAGADYLVVGTVFATPSHPDRVGAGPELVRDAVAETRLPVVAIGGITPRRVGAVRRAGAHGVAVLSGVWDAPDPPAAVGAFLAALG